MDAAQSRDVKRGGDPALLRDPGIQKPTKGTDRRQERGRWLSRWLGPALAAVLGLAAQGTAISLGQTGPLSMPNAGATALVSLVRPDAATRNRVSQAYGRLPLHFEANRGQDDPRVKFLSRGSGYSLFLTPTGAVLSLSQKPREGGAVLFMHLLGASPAPLLEGVEPLSGKSHYFIGNDPTRWHTGIPHYARVRYRRIYPGIDLVFYGNRQQLEYDFVVAPGADPRAIRLAFEGADRLRLDHAGNLILRTAGDEILQRVPLIYQEINGTRRKLPGRYVLQGKDRVGFEVGAYDPSRPLVVDPVLVYSTYLGGSRSDGGNGIAVDSSGNAYVIGQTESPKFPTTNLLEPPPPGGGVIFTAIFVTKLNPAGSALVYSTYLSNATGTGIAVDVSGNAYVTGWAGRDFPTTPGAFDPSFNSSSDIDASSDAFVTKLNPDGSALVYSTYLGGSKGDTGKGIVVDSSGNAYVTGDTNSNDFPTSHPFRSTLSGDSDAFVAKLNPDGSALVYSTYLGGGSKDAGKGIALDTSGNAYVTGWTSSTDFPTAHPFQSAFGGGSFDAFVTKLNPDGSALDYSTYLGGSGDDFGFGIALDSSGNAYVTGETSSTNFPTAHPFQGSLAGSFDAFVAKLSSASSTLVYSTYLGGNGTDLGAGIVVDSANNAYVTGQTNSLNFPTASPLQTFGGGGSIPLPSDAFVAKLNPDGFALAYSTYLGGTKGDLGNGIAVDAAGNAYVTGKTESPDFPITAGPFQPALGGGFDAFVAKISTMVADLALTQTDSPDPLAVGVTLTYTVTVTNNGPDAATGVTLTDTLPGSVTFVSANPSQGSCSGMGPVSCTLGSLANGASATVTLVVTPTAIGSITNTASVTGNETDPNSGNDSASEPTTVNLDTHTHTITATAGVNGRISPPGVVTVNDGASQTFTISPAANYHVADVKVDGSSVGAVASYTFINVTADHTLEATFTLDTHTLTITSGPSGSPNPVASEGAVGLSVMAADSLGHSLSYAWTASCPSLGSNGSFNSTTSRTPTWTAPANTTGNPQNCVIQVAVSDGQGLSQSSQYQQAVNRKIDTTAPDTFIDDKPSNPSNTTSATFTFHSTKAGSSFECQMDGGVFSACTSPKSYTGPTDGSHTFRVRARDAAGNLDPTPASYTWLIDTLPPNPPLVTGTTPTNDATPIWSWTSGGGGGNGTYRYRLDNSDLTAGATETTATSYTPANSLPDGPHILYVQERDAAGNWSSYGNMKIMIDTTALGAPSVTGTTPTNDTTPTWSWTSGGGGNGTYRYKLDNPDLSTGATETTATSYTPANSLPDGPHILYVQERDAAGNWSSSERKEIVIQTTFYVSPSGNDANDGSLNAPWRTIQHALELAHPGQTVYVRGGAYNEALEFRGSGAPDAPITLSGYPGEAAVLDGAGLNRPIGVYLGDYDNLIVQNLTVRNYTGTGVGGGYNNDNVTLRNLEISSADEAIGFNSSSHITIENVTASQYSVGIFLVGFSDVIIRNVRLMGPRDGGEGVGIHGSKGNRLLVEKVTMESHPSFVLRLFADNVTVRQVEARGYSKWGPILNGANVTIENSLFGGQVGALLLTGVGPYTIRNNLFHTGPNGYYSAYIVPDNASTETPLTPVTLIGNIFYILNNASILIISRDVKLQANDNLYYSPQQGNLKFGEDVFSPEEINDGTWARSMGTDEASRYADPLFIDANAGNYQLQEGSPAIDIVPGDQAPAVDLLDRPRPQGGGAEIGPYELEVQATLTVSKSGTGSGTVTSFPAGIDCGEDCSEGYETGTKVTLTATAEAGSTFTGWRDACSGTGPCTLTLDRAMTATALFVKPLSLGTSALEGEVGVAFHSSLGIGGGLPPYTIRLEKGILPLGLDLNSEGLIGTPTKAGSSSFTVQVTDALNSSASQKVSMKVFKALGIASKGLGKGKVGKKYGTTLKATGGKGPYTWSSLGQFPAGLNLESSTGKITGIPVESGSFALTFQVTDGLSGTASKGLTLDIK